MLTNAGSVSCWGRNDRAQLGDGTTSNRLSPVAVQGLPGEAVAVATGKLHTCALLVTGAVYCWGQGAFGQLGDNAACGLTCPLPQSVAGVSDVIAIAAGWVHTCALREQGTVTCWGNNYHGQIGNNHVGDVRLPPMQVQQLSGVVNIAAGDWHTCALTVTGGLRCWGEDLPGQLGDGFSGVNRPLPVDVIGLGSGVAAVAGGGKHTCALLVNGTVKCWGTNDFGQLGIGSLTGIYTTPQTVPGLSGVSRIALGYEHTCAALTNGGLRCWGRDQFGQLGDGATGTQTLPAPVAGLTGVVSSLGLGVNHSCGLSGGGSLRCWGRNSSGQIGDGTTVNRATPVAVLGVKASATPTPLPTATGPCSDSDGDGLTDCVEQALGTDPHDADTDADGCSDGAELGPNEVLGGRRDPLNFWDFYDVWTEDRQHPGTFVRDKKVNLDDIIAIGRRFASVGQASLADALRSPTAASGYHPDYDRGPNVGPGRWDLGPADGGITITDLLAAIPQFGHTCL